MADDSGGLVTWAALIARWHAADVEQARRWKLKSLAGTRGRSALFRMADVLRAEERAAKEGGAR